MIADGPFVKAWLTLLCWGHSRDRHLAGTAALSVLVCLVPNRQPPGRGLALSHGAMRSTWTTLSARSPGGSYDKNKRDTKADDMVDRDADVAGANGSADVKMDARTR